MTWRTTNLPVREPEHLVEYYDPDPVSRPRTQSEIEDAAYDVHCLDCGARLGDDDQDWPGDGKRCPECVEVAAELAEEGCAESESCAPTNRTGT